MDGWVSLEVSPLLAHDTASTLAAAKELHARAGRPNLFIKIPGTKEGLPAIEEAIFAGVPINVTLLFSREHYLAAAEAFLRGIERRIDAGLNPDVGSVASVFISRWDAAVAGKVPDALRNRLGIAIAKRTYKAYRDAARARRAGSASTTPAPGRSACCGPARDQGPEGVRRPLHQGAGRAVHGQHHARGTLKALRTTSWLLPADGGDCEEVLAEFAKAGIDSMRSLPLQEGRKSFVKSWNELMAVIASKSAAVTD